MQVKNLQYYSDLDFDEYLQISGYSFSGIKMLESGQAIIPTEGMKLGTRVHNFILEPKKYDWENHIEVNKIATKIREIYQPFIKYMEPELAFTCRFEHNGMYLNYKGRTDLIYKGKLIVDLKILSGKLEPAIERFGYDKQLSGYALATGCKNAMIISYNKANKHNVLETKLIEPNHDWWNYMVIKYGTPI
jgi:hypothetical protein